MKKQFLFYTPQGYTESPTGKRVENLQILGFAFGETSEQAKRQFLNGNAWVVDCGFDESQINYLQISE